MAWPGAASSARVWDTSALDEAEMLRGVVAQAPRLVHAFHAWRTGPLASTSTAAASACRSSSR